MNTITLPFLNQNYHYIARDKDNALYVFCERPILDEATQTFYTDEVDKCEYINEALFQLHIFQHVTYDNSPLKIIH